MVGSSQKSRNCVRTTMQDTQQITCQSSPTCTRDPDARTTIHAVADHGRRKHRMSTDLRDLIRQIFPRHNLCSRVVNKCTVIFTTMSGRYGRALHTTRPGETQRHGTLWTIKPWKCFAHYMLYVRCAAFFDTLSEEFLMLIPTGKPEDIRLALRRREQREMKNKKSNVSNLLEEAQWVRGKALPKGNRGTPWKKAPNNCRCDVLRTTRDVWESVAAHSPNHGGTGSRE